MPARYLRLVNVHMPGGGPFSVRDLRIFGNDEGKPPAAAPRFEVHRDTSDSRNAVEMLPDAGGYIVRYDIAPGKLYQNDEVRGQKEITIHGLNMEAAYHFTVDAFHDSGRTPGTPVLAR